MYDSYMGKLEKDDLKIEMIQHECELLKQQIQPEEGTENCDESLNLFVSFGKSEVEHEEEMKDYIDH